MAGGRKHQRNKGAASSIGGSVTSKQSMAMTANSPKNIALAAAKYGAVMARKRRKQYKPLAAAIWRKWRQA